jgi:hypothetical protein
MVFKGSNMSDEQYGMTSAMGETPAEENVESQEGGEEQEVAAQPETKAEEKAAEVKRTNKLKLKVYGKEVEEDLPFEIDEGSEAVEYLTKQLQLSKAAQQSMQENSSYKNQVQQFLQSFKSDTRGALLQMGIDPKEFAAAVIEDEIKKSQLSPEQRELEELRNEKKKYEEDRKKDKDDQERKELTRLQDQEYERIETQMSAALEKSSLPKESYVVKKIADYMMVGLQNGVDLSPEDVLPLVENEIKADLQALIRALGEDKVEEFVGKDVFNKIRKRNLSKAKNPAPIASSVKDVGSQPKAKEGKPADKVSLKDFFKI